MAEMTEEEFLKQYSPDAQASEEEAFLAKYAPQETVSPQQQSIDEFIRSQQAGPLEKIGRTASGLLNAIIVEPVKSIGGVTSGIAEEAGAASTVPGGLLPGGQLQRNLLQTGAESGARVIFNLGDTIRNLVDQAATQVVGNPLEVGLRAASPPLSALMNLVPRTPSDDEIANFVANQLRQQQTQAVLSQPLVPEVIGETNLPLAGDIETFTETVVPVAPAAGPLLRGTARGIQKGISGAKTVASLPVKAAKTVASSIKRLPKNLAGPTMEDSIIGALNPALDEIDDVISRVPTAVERTIQTTGKVPETAQEAISAMKQTRKRIYDERLETNNAAEQSGYVVNGDEAVREAEDVLNNLTGATAKEKTSILDEIKELYSGEKKPSEGQTIQEQLNDEFSSAFANGTLDKASPRFQARLAVRNSVARQMDEITQAVTGLPDSPYSDIGNLIEVQGNLENTFNQLRKSRAAIKTGLKKIPGRLPGSKTEAATKITKEALTPFQKTQIDILNENVKRIFGEQIQRPPILPLESEVVNQLRSVRSPVPVSPEVTLEQLIQDTINNLPREMRGRNERAIAEAIVRSGQAQTP